MRLIVAAFVAFALTGQQKPSDLYQFAIAKYVAGDTAAACQAVARVPQPDVQREVQTLLTAFQSNNTSTAISRAERRQLQGQLEAIAMLHTDCPSVDIIDPNVALFHVDIAHLALTTARWSLTDQLPDADDQDTRRRAREFLPHWYAVATGVLLSYFGDQNATRLIDEGVKLFPEDQTLLFWRGLVMEFTAVWVGVRPVGPNTAKQLELARSGLPMARAWVSVEDAFRHVTQKDPNQFEAHLHRGYALYSLHKYAEARTEYEVARDRSSDRFVVYLGDLLLARLEEDQNHLESAVHDYEHALATIPGAQNAYIGLGVVEARLGNAQRARELTQFLAAIPANERVRDPWWAFHTSRIPVDDLQWLQHAVRK